VAIVAVVEVKNDGAVEDEGAAETLMTASNVGLFNPIDRRWCTTQNRCRQVREVVLVVANGSRATDYESTDCS